MNSIKIIFFLLNRIIILAYHISFCEEATGYNGGEAMGQTETAAKCVIKVLRLKLAEKLKKERNWSGSFNSGFFNKHFDNSLQNDV